MLTNYKCGHVKFILGQIHKGSSRYLFLLRVWKWLILDNTSISQLGDNELKSPLTVLYLAATRAWTPGDTAKPRFLIWGTSSCSWRYTYDYPTYDTSVMHESWWRHQMETFSALLAICAGIHRSPVNSLHKGRWRGALMFLWSAPA